MKKLLLVLILCFIPINPVCTARAESKDEYARIIESAPLYTTKSKSDSIYFYVPESYFVIIKTKGEEMIEVSYDGITGYMEAKYLESVNFTPTEPYDNKRTLSIKKDSSTYLKSSPTIDSDTLKILECGRENIKYYGKVKGSTPPDGITDIWYYVVIYESATKVHFGYVYSERTENLTEFQKNTEGIVEPTPEISLPTLSNDVTVLEEAEEEIKEMNPLTKWLLIIFLTLPTVLIFILLIKKPKKNPNFDDKTDKTPENPDILDEFSIESNNQIKNLTKNPQNKTKKPANSKPNKLLYRDSDISPSTEKLVAEKSPTYMKFFKESPPIPDDEELM